jgi:hypothetical protein
MFIPGNISFGALLEKTGSWYVCLHCSIYSIIYPKINLWEKVLESL